MKHEFSKIILAAVMLLYFAGAILAGIVVITEHYGLEVFLTYLGAPTATAIGFYAWKAKAENVLKISQAVDDKNTKISKETKKILVENVAKALNDTFNSEV